MEFDWQNEWLQFAAQACQRWRLTGWRSAFLKAFSEERELWCDFRPSPQFMAYGKNFCHLVILHLDMRTYRTGESSTLSGGGARSGTLAFAGGITWASSATLPLSECSLVISGSLAPLRELTPFQNFSCSGRELPLITALPSSSCPPRGAPAHSSVEKGVAPRGLYRP